MKTIIIFVLIIIVMQIVGFGVAMLMRKSPKKSDED